MRATERAEVQKYKNALNEIKNGKKQGLRYLYDEYMKSLYVFVYSETHSKEESSDIICDFYKHIWENPSSYAVSNYDEVLPFLRGRLKKFMLKDARNCL